MDYDMQNDSEQTLRSDGEKSSPDVRTINEIRFGPGEEHAIVCKNCGNTITNSKSIIAINGNNRHTFINPSGLTYQIACFSSANGCVVFQESIIEHTWFENFSWSLCICSNCLLHLGWFYRKEEQTFFGLILDLLEDITMTH